MSIEIGDKKVKKIMVGDKVVYKDSDGWVPLALPDGVSGTVLFKDNGDGTACLAGAVAFSMSGPGWVANVIKPPVGYRFAKTDWPAKNTYAFVSGSTITIAVAGSVTNGLIGFTVYEPNVSNTFAGRVLFSLTSYTTASTSAGAEPALVEIEKV